MTAPERREEELVACGRALLPPERPITGTLYTLSLTRAVPGWWEAHLALGPPALAQYAEQGPDLLDGERIERAATARRRSLEIIWEALRESGPDGLLDALRERAERLRDDPRRVARRRADEALARLVAAEDAAEEAADRAVSGARADLRAALRELREVER